MQDVWDVDANEISFEEARDLYGFDGADNPGSTGKYFGKPQGDGPWFYIIKHRPHTVIPRHTHEADVYHYLVAGSWTVGAERELKLPGFFHFEPKGVFWGPLVSGDEGSEFIAVYTDKPSFIPAAGNEPGYVAPDDTSVA